MLLILLPLMASDGQKHLALSGTPLDLKKLLESIRTEFDEVDDRAELTCTISEAETGAMTATFRITDRQLEAASVERSIDAKMLNDPTRLLHELRRLVADFLDLRLELQIDRLHQLGTEVGVACGEEANAH